MPRNYKRLKVTKLIPVFIILFSFLSGPLVAQKRDKLKYEAKVLKGGTRNGESYQKLIGDVKFTQKKTVIHCDSAIFFKKDNKLEAFGKVKIHDMEDSVDITSDKLYYNGDNKVAELRGNVVYIDDSIRLYTENLDYDMTNKSATYFNGGEIVDGVNRLQSVNGTYDTENKMMNFRNDIKLTNPDYTLESQDLFYNIITKRAKTTTKTKITTAKGDVMYADDGSEFDTSRDSYSFLKGEVDTDEYHMTATQILLNNAEQYYSAKGDVRIRVKKDSIIITGDEAKFWDRSGIAKVYGNALFKKNMSGDTLYMKSDTLVSIDDSLAVNKRLLAYHNVKIFKSDLQGKSDSLAYFVGDSTMYMYTNPVLWNETSQISADSINIRIANGSIDQMNTRINSFIISQDTINNYNQVKGRKMVAYFKNNAIDWVDVTGNGESLYFVLDDKTNEFIGMNKVICANMKILFEENRPKEINFYVGTEGLFIPPHELKEEEKMLEEFVWSTEERPKLEEMLSFMDNKENGEEKGAEHETDQEKTENNEKIPRENLKNDQKEP